MPNPSDATSDLIAALATPPGRGGVGVIRLSGIGLAVLAQEIAARKVEARKAHWCRFTAANGELIDEGLLLFFPAPASFTGEDVIELQGHGGPMVMQMLLQRCFEFGARPAQAGEFSQRAFLNGKMDLAQAEAVADLIDAETTAAARLALRSLSGRFSEETFRIRDALIDLRMLVEASLDFPEEDIDFLERGHACQRLAHLCRALQSLLDRSTQGSLLRRGLSVVLVGAPNVGKSSLLNRLAGEERAIVTEFAGTTRDSLREAIQIEGIPLHIIDTAGLRETEDAIERIGIQRTWQEIERADAVLWLQDVSDASAPSFAESDLSRRLPPGAVILRLINKIDLRDGISKRTEREGEVCIHLSAKQGLGIDLLQQELLRIAGWHAHGEDVYLARERHLVALRAALAHAERAGEQIACLELMAEELRLAQDALAQVTGEFSSDDLLGEIFSRFCIGK